MAHQWHAQYRPSGNNKLHPQRQHLLPSNNLNQYPRSEDSLLLRVLKLSKHSIHRNSNARHSDSKWKLCRLGST